jgi:hypothetical protein
VPLGLLAAAPLASLGQDATPPEAPAAEPVQADPAGPAAPPPPSVNPAGQVRDLLDQRLQAAESRQEEIAVDLTVLTANETLEAQLMRARLEAEGVRLGETLSGLGESLRQAVTASDDLGAFADPAEVDEVYSRLKDEADAAQLAFASYRASREQRIARAEEAASPTGAAPAPVAGEVAAYLRGAIDGMDELRRVDFLAVVYAVAAELGVRVHRTLDGGKQVLSDYADVLDAPPAAQNQMALLALVAYRNRQLHPIGGTLLGPTVEELVQAQDVAPVQGQSYRVGSSALRRHLLEPLFRTWGEDGVVLVPGDWDLSKRPKTAAAMARFASGEDSTPDPVLLGVLTQVETTLAARERSDAITSELERVYAQALAEARRIDLDLEGVAGTVFQADGLGEQKEASIASVEAARAFFAEEAARLADPANRPRHQEIAAHAAALREARIALQRAIQISRHLAGAPARGGG